VIRGDDLRAALPLLDVLDEPLASPLPPPIEARVRASRLMALAFLEPGSPASQQAAEDAMAFSTQASEVADAINSCGFAGIVYVHAGRLEDAEAARRTARALMRAAPHDPLARLAFLVGEGWLDLTTGDPAGSLHAAEEGLALGELSGITAWQTHLAGLACIAAVALADLPKAEKLLAMFEEALPVYASRYLRSFFFYTRSRYWMGAGDREQALADARAARRPALEGGFPLLALMSCQVEILTLVSCGRLGELEDPRRALARIFETFNPSIVESTQQLVDAFAELAVSGLAAARQHLVRAFASEVRGSVLPVATNQVWATLVSAALELEIEPAYVATLVQRHRLEPPADDTGPVWPWPLVVRTLGQFSLVAAERRSEGRPPAGPLRMFKALLAAGGAPVRRERLIADLWAGKPATEGRTVFDTTLHRLRRTLGDESLVRFENGEVSLDPRRIWCDAWALVHLQKQVRKSTTGADELARLDRRLRGLHRGPFCPDEPEPFIARARERLARTFAETAATLTDGWLRVGEVKQAVALLETALDTDELNEPLYAKLIGVHAQLRASAEAVRVYDRCTRILRARLGVDPSPETVRVVAKLRAAAV